MDVTGDVLNYIESYLSNYYGYLSKNRDGMAAQFYTPNSKVLFQGTLCKTQQDIHDKFTSMSFTNLQVELSQKDVLAVSDSAYMVSCYGRLQDEGNAVFQFTHSLLLVVVNQDLKIQNEIFSLLLHNG